MERFWTDTELNDNRAQKQISIWQWIGRTIPMLVIVTFTSFYFFGTEDNTKVTLTVLISMLSIIPIVWWWWAMDIMSWLSSLYKTTLTHQIQILDELKSIKQEYHSIKNASSSDR